MNFCYVLIHLDSFVCVVWVRRCAQRKQMRHKRTCHNAVNVYRMQYAHCIIVGACCIIVCACCIIVGTYCIIVDACCIIVGACCIIAPFPPLSWPSCSLSQWKCRRRVPRDCTTSSHTPGPKLLSCCILQKLWTSWQLLSPSLHSRTSKVFPNHQMAQQSGCVPCFAEVGVHAGGITL